MDSNVFSILCVCVCVAILQNKIIHTCLLEDWVIAILQIRQVVCVCGGLCSFAQWTHTYIPHMCIKQRLNVGG